MSNIPQFTIRQMIESGVHYGHKTNRWNPKMSPFIYGAKGNLHIIDLTQTYSMLQQALRVVESIASSNGKILFIGTKRQSSQTIAEYAEKCKQYYVNYRWLGGMLTNWTTVSNSIEKLNKIEESLANEEADITKKERLNLSRQQEKLNKSLGGIRELSGKPSLVIVFDTLKESIAIKEAKKLGVPIIAIVDTNASLENINYPIPGNDDSAKATAFFCNLFAETIINSRNVPTEVTKKEETKEDKKEASVKKAEAPAKKSEAKEEKTEAEKAPAQKAETKTPAKKTTAKKADDEKPAKKAPAKKTAAKKADANPAAEKKAPAKKAAAKKAEPVETAASA